MSWSATAGSASLSTPTKTPGIPTRSAHDSFARPWPAVGIDVSVKIVGDPWSFARRPNSPVDILLDGWVPDYLDPAGIVNELFDPDLLGSGFYPAFFKDAAWLARLRAAARVTGTRRPAVYERLDRDLALGPTPAVPLAFMAGTAQLFSERVGCHTFLPQYAGLVDFASLCLK